MNPPEATFGTITELFAALPYLLGFVPTDNLVTLLLSTEETADTVKLGVAINTPLTIDEDQAAALPAECNLTADRYPSAILVAVCGARHDEHARRILTVVRTALARRGIAVQRMLMSHSVTEAGRWVDADTGEQGDTMPYTDSAATAWGVLQGQLIAPSRADIEREFAMTEPAPAFDPAGRDLRGLVIDTATDLHRAITETAGPTADLAARAGYVTTLHSGLRDQYLRLAAGHELAAARVWTHLAAQHRGRTRAELLAMAAVAYYAGEDTVRAGVAITHIATAVRDRPEHLPKLAVLVHTSLYSGLPPATVRELLTDPGTTRGD